MLDSTPSICLVRGYTLITLDEGREGEGQPFITYSNQGEGAGSQIRVLGDISLLIKCETQSGYENLPHHPRTKILYNSVNSDMC